MTPGKGLRARGGENAGDSQGETARARATDGATVPPEASASEASEGRTVEVSGVGGEETGAKKSEKGGVMADDTARDGGHSTEASGGARVSAARAYADVQTPKNVKKIAWQTAGASSERVTRKSMRSATRGGAPVSTVKNVRGDAEMEDGAAPREDAPESKSVAAAKIEEQQDPSSAGQSSEKRKRAKARANGMAFLKADIPALAAQNPKAGGAVVSTELRISPRMLAADKAKQSASKEPAAAPGTTTMTSESKEPASAPTVVAPVLAPRTVAPKHPVDQRSLMESFMIQPENVSAAVDLAPLSSFQKMSATPSQVKAFQSMSLNTPSHQATLGEQSAQRPKPPSSLAPVTTAAEANDVMSRLKRAMEARSRADEENKRQLESALRQKEEERKRREMEMQARKAKQADQEAREREERRLRQERLAQFRLQEEEAQRKAAMEKSKWAKMLEEQKKATFDVSTKPMPVSLKRTSGQSGFTSSASHEAEKRRRLLENAQAAIHGHSHQSSAAMRTPTRSIFRTNFASSSSQQQRTPLDSYPISPYCSSDSEDDERPKKMIPGWARGDALVPQLKAQSYVDPDDIFPNPSLTCSLGKIFKKSSHDRRRSSSNWAHDRLTLQEELSYKQKMGFR